MIVGIGIDLLENRRFARELARSEWLPADGILTPEEIVYCRSATKPARRYAACFAAKEATLKALGLRVSDLRIFREVQMSPGTNGQYQVSLHGRPNQESAQLGVRRIWLAISSSRIHTGAMVILENS